MFSASMFSLDRLKKDRFIIANILWDFEPKELMQPRCRITGQGTEYAASPSGYILYIETMDRKPGLFLMIQNSGGCAETLAKIEGIPDEMLAEAIEENKSKVYFGMYPISKKLKGWLKKELGVAGQTRQ